MKAPNPKPCNQCPFRRDSLPGWLGDTTPEQFVATAHSDLPMPCHAEVDYEDPRWGAKLQDVHQCSGRAIYLKHICKLPRDPEVVVLPADRASVFSGPNEFLTHHNRTESTIHFSCSRNRPSPPPRVGEGARKVGRRGKD